MSGRKYTISLIIESSEKYKAYLEDIVFDYPGVSDNIAYHLAYLEYLYQLQKQIPLEKYPVLHGLRIKTIITDIASCAEVLLYDALTNLTVVDKWNNRKNFKLRPNIGFSVILDYAFEYKVINKQLKGRLHKLFDLRHKIHLTHRERDPFGFTNRLLRDSEKTLEDLFKHFLQTRSRGMSQEEIDPDLIPLPWKNY